MKRIIYIAIAALALSSCGLYKQYEREDMQFVDSLYRRMSVTQDSISTLSLIHILTLPTMAVV